MLLIDKKTTKTTRSSLFLVREEFKKLYPHRLNSRLNYIFSHERPQEVIYGEALLLLKKYPHVVRWGKHLTEEPTDRYEELLEMKYQDLKKVGAEAGLNFRELGCTKAILIDKIIDKEKE